MSETRDLAIPSAEQGQAIVRMAPIEALRPLDIYARGFADEEPRVDWLATISAGYMGMSKRGEPIPQRSMDGTIYLHDDAETPRAPGLAAALAATGGKRLTIALPSNEPSDFLRMHFAAYSRTRLEAFGDQRRITTIRITYQEEKVPGGETRRVAVPERLVYEAGTPEYEQALAGCKVTCSLYFLLADWLPDGSARILMPDGLGLYRLRFTSRNSLRNIISSLQSIARWTHGRLMGLPLDLQITYREAADGKGERHRIPTWSLTMRPPAGIQLTSRTFRDLALSGLLEGEALVLPEPETWETAERDAELAAVDMDDPRLVHTETVVDRATGEVLTGGVSVEVEQPSEQEAETIARGGACNAHHWEACWFLAVQGSRYDTDEARAAWLESYTAGRTNSLREYLATATEAEASALIRALEVQLAAEAANATGGIVGQPTVPELQPQRVSQRVLDRWAELWQRAKTLQEQGYIGQQPLDLLAVPLGATLETFTAHGKELWALIEQAEANKAASKAMEALDDLPTA